MSDPNADEAGNRPVRLIYKIVAYVAIWIVALLLTAPGLWPLAWMFPLGLLAVINRHTANAGGWAMGYFDGSKMKVWQWAREYTLADHFFMAAFGGSYLPGYSASCVRVWSNHAT